MQLLLNFKLNKKLILFCIIRLKFLLSESLSFFVLFRFNTYNYIFINIKMILIYLNSIAIIIDYIK